MSEIPRLMINRAAEMKQLRESLERYRLVALVGPAGIGKTTLARQIASSHSDTYPGGIHFVQGYEIGRGFEGRGRPSSGGAR